MASFVLGTVGSALGGPIGGFIGSAIGSYLDNNFLFPIKTEGPRLQDLTVTASTYGKPITLMWGPENRLAGNVIWSDGLTEHKTKRKVSGKGGPAQKITEYSYTCSFAVLLGEGTIRGIRKIWANNKLIFDRDQPHIGAVVSTGSGGLWAALRVYPGDHQQLPDPTIQAKLGGDTPAYRGSAYVVFESLQLADFGNRLPNLEFLVSGQEEITTAGIVVDIIKRCGLDPMLASTVALSDPVRGYAIGRETSGVAAIKPLTLAFNFDVAEAGGALRATNRDASLVAVLPRADTGAVDGQLTDPPKWEWGRGQVTQLPREAALTYPDPERDYQANTQTDRRTEGSADSVLSGEISIVMTADHAKAVASRMLWEAWSSTQTLTTAVTDRWINLQAGLSYLVETPAGWEPLRLRTMTRGANGIIEIEMLRNNAEVYSSLLPGAHAGVPENVVRIPGSSELVLLDLPLLVEADKAKESGFYVGVITDSPTWRGAQVMRSQEAAGTYDPIGDFGYDLITGTTTAAVPAPPAGYDSATDFDDTTTIRVTLHREDLALSSVSDAELQAGGNAIYLGPRSGQGGEVIQFGVATLVAPGVYDLTHLKRGQRGTEYAWSHPTGAFLALLETAALQRVDFGYGDVGVTSYYKAVSLLTDEEDAAVVAWTNGGAGLRPYAPVDLQLDGVTGGDLELSWVRRSRIGFGITPPPLGEEFERYVVQIRNAAGTSTVRQVEVDTPEFTYTAAMQAADFGGPVSTLRWRVAQISAAYGPGTFATVTSVV